MMIRRLVAFVIYLSLLAILGNEVAFAQTSHVVKVEIYSDILYSGVRLNHPAGSSVVSVMVSNASDDETARDVTLTAALDPELPPDTVYLSSPNLGDIGPGQKAPPVSLRVKYPAMAKPIGKYLIGVGAVFKDSSGKEKQSVFISFNLYVLPNIPTLLSEIEALPDTVGEKDYSATKGLVKGLLDLIPKKIEDYYPIYDPSLKYITKIWKAGKDIDEKIRNISGSNLDLAEKALEEMRNSLPLFHSEVIQKVREDPPRGSLLKIHESLSQMVDTASMKIEKVSGSVMGIRQEADEKLASAEANYRNAEDTKYLLQKKASLETAIKEYGQAKTLYSSIYSSNNLSLITQREGESIAKLNEVIKKIQEIEKCFNDGKKALNDARNLKPLTDRLSRYKTAEGLLKTAVEGYTNFPDPEKQRQARDALAEAETGSTKTEAEISNNRKEADNQRRLADDELKAALQEKFLSGHLSCYSQADKLLRKALELYENIPDEGGISEAKKGLAVTGQGIKDTTELIKEPDKKMADGQGRMAKASGEPLLIRRQEHFFASCTAFQLASDGYARVPNDTKRTEAENWLKRSQKGRDDIAGEISSIRQQADQAVVSSNDAMSRANSTNLDMETRLAAAREAERLCQQAGQLYGRLPDENKMKESQMASGNAKLRIADIEKEIKDAETAGDSFFEKAKTQFNTAAGAQFLKDSVVAYSSSKESYQKAQNVYASIPRQGKAQNAEAGRLNAIEKGKEIIAEIDKLRSAALELKRQGLNHQQSAQKLSIPFLAIPRYQSSLESFNKAMALVIKIGREGEKEAPELEALVNEVSAAINQKRRENPVWLGGFAIIGVMIAAFLWRYYLKVAWEKEDRKIEADLFPRR